jgi:RHS repeat-associated protein
LTTSEGRTSFARETYDANGRQTQSGSRTYTWNLADQLTSTAASGVTTTYSYDGDGNRLQTAGSSTTNYLWDQNAELPHLAVERNGSGSTTRSYTHGTALLGVVSGGQHYYFHRDAIGSVRNVTTSSAQTEWTYSYEPFGAARSETKNDPMAPENPIRFAGELFDSAGELYDLRARQYDPTVGRFASRDPRPAEHRRPYEATYVYGHNNPTTFVDPSGQGSVWGFIAWGSCTALTVQVETSPLPLNVKAAWLVGYLGVCVGPKAIGEAGKWLGNRLSNSSVDEIVGAASGCVTGVVAGNEVVERTQLLLPPQLRIPWFLGWCGLGAVGGYIGVDLPPL